jgi:hypothetical protein
MVIDENIKFNNSLLRQISRELQNERDDLLELSEMILTLEENFSQSSKSDILNPVKLALKLKNINKNYRNIFSTLISVAINEDHNSSFIILDYDKIEYFAKPHQVNQLKDAYCDILKNRDSDREFGIKEFETFINRCSSIVNEIISVAILRPNTDLFITNVDLI